MPNKLKYYYLVLVLCGESVTVRQLTESCFVNMESGF